MKPGAGLEVYPLGVGRGEVLEVGALARRDDFAVRDEEGFNGSKVRGEDFPAVDDGARGHEPTNFVSNRLVSVGYMRSTLTIFLLPQSSTRHWILNQPYLHQTNEQILHG